MALDEDEKRQIRNEARRAFPGIAFPDELTAWLTGIPPSQDYISNFLAGLPPGRAVQPTEAEVAAMALYALYGPIGHALPTDHQLEDLINHAGLAPGFSQRHVERALVFCLPSPVAPPGRPVATGASDVLFQTIRRQIYAAVQWIGSRVLHLNRSLQWGKSPG